MILKDGNMRLLETSFADEPLYECDNCRVAGAEGSSIILQPDGLHFCFSCWYERNCGRPRGEKTAVEM